MNLLLLLLLLQDRPIDASIEAFLKDDAAARAELVKLGAYAIRPLQKAREKNPEKIDALVFELKKAAAFPRTAKFDEDLGGSNSVSARRFGAITLGHIGPDSLPFFLDSFDTERVATPIKIQGRTARQMADQICKQTGLDFGYFHNAIVFAHPDRLWPPMPAPDKGEITGAALDRAKALVAQLNHELLEKREAASRELLQMGRGLAPFLKEQLTRSDPEFAGRCRALLQELTPKSGAFRPAAAVSQELDEAGREVLRRLTDSRFYLRADDSLLKRIIEIVNASQPVVCEISDEPARKMTSIRIPVMSAMDFLSLLTQSLDLDFMIRGTGVWIDTREAIQKAISKGSK